MKRRADGVSDAYKKTEEEMTPPTPEVMDPVKRAKSRKSVIVYIATLFAVVLFFIALSYFVQVRNNTEISALHAKNATAQQNIENLQNDNLTLKAENDSNKKQLDDLKNKISDLENANTAQIQQEQTAIQNVQQADEDKYDALLSRYNAMAKKYGFKEYTP